MTIMEPRRSEGRKKNVTMQPVSGCGWLAAALR